MSFLIGTVCIIGILFMLTFMFIGIWLFIIALKSYNQLRYKNYILEKINQKLSLISKSREFSLDNDFDETNIPGLFDNNDFNNIEDFEKREQV